MFGFKWKRPRPPMRLVPFAEERPHTFGALLCDGVAARNLASFAGLLALHARLQAERPEVRILATLDNLGQATYTSGHAVDAFELDDIAGHDISQLGYEDPEDHPGYLGTPEEFPIRLANLHARAAAVDLDQLAGLLLYETAGDDNGLVAVNTDAEAALRLDLEKEVIFQFVPVASAADTVAAFPNGYFKGSLDPMQNHLLARHLESEYGLALFGIGSRFLAFRRPAALGEAMARALAAELAALYAGTPPAQAEALARMLAGRDWLLLRYTES